MERVHKKFLVKKMSPSKVLDICAVLILISLYKIVIFRFNISDDFIFIKRTERNVDKWSQRV